jgi:hypothetical protein
MNECGKCGVNWAEKEYSGLCTSCNATEYAKSLNKNDFADYGEELRSQNARLTRLETAHHNTMKRLAGLESRVDNQALSITLKSQAAQVEATENLYAPLRTDTAAILDLAAFARRLLDPEDLGHAVTKEVRDLARKALGLK